MAMFLLVYLGKSCGQAADKARPTEFEPPRLFALSLLTALIVLTRLDLLLLVAPALLEVLWRQRGTRTLGLAALGLSPLLGLGRLQSALLWLCLPQYGLCQAPYRYTGG